MPHPPAILALATDDVPSERAGAIVETAASVRDWGTDVDRTLEWCVSVGSALYSVGAPGAREVWEVLASAALADVAAARILEPHLDAVAILAQAGRPDLSALGVTDSSTWGVFAAEGAGVRLVAGKGSEGRWTLSGTKPWCSLASRLSHALVTAHLDDGGRRLFAVDLHAAGVSPHAGPWVSRGLAPIVSAPVDFDSVPAVPVGEAGWYLERPGFAWGGVGVAACWWGGAMGLLAPIAAACAAEDPLALMHLGASDAALWGARSALADAAARADDENAPNAAAPPALVAARVRSVVAGSVETTLAHAAHALGPGPLTTDEHFARRVADLAIYVRQHHAERDEASLGRSAMASGRPW